MKSRQLGKTKLQVTELGYGGAPLGNLYHAITNVQADDSLQAAWDGGIRYYDTAPQYGSGLSEQFLLSLVLFLLTNYIHFPISNNN